MFSTVKETLKIQKNVLFLSHIQYVLIWNLIPEQHFSKAGIEVYLLPLFYHPKHF